MNWRLSILLLIFFTASCSDRVPKGAGGAWPSYRDLPETLQSGRHPVKLEDKAFVTEDGRRAFVIGVAGRDDPRFDLYGKRNLDDLPPNYGLYDPRRLGWIYEQPLNAKSAARLGFNLYAASLTPKPFYELVAYRAKVPEDPNYIGALARALRIPFYVDYVAWPWGLGAPGQPNAGVLPAECLNPDGIHWMPYRTIGEGKNLWLRMWRLYTQRLHDSNVPVLMYELFNEPGYAAQTLDHRKEFIRWLQKRYGSLAGVNHTWGSSWTSWEAIRDFPSPKSNPSFWLDYDEYLAGTFHQLFQAGQEAIREIDPNAVCVIQPMRRGALIPLDGVHYHKLINSQEVIVAPTNGGLWTPGKTSDQRAKNWEDAPLAPAPISSDLVLQMAGSKMLFDNELYLTGQTRRATRNDWWTHVLLGYDGATLFSWSKRGWAWWHGKKALEEEAKKHPYSCLLPLARRTEALRGILDFAAEMEKVRDRILPKPWGPEARVGFLWSWGNTRRLAWEGRLPEKAMRYWAALRYTHWPIAMLPSSRATRKNLARFQVILLAGMRFLEREVARNLETYVRNGGTLLIGEDMASLTPYGRPNGFSELLDVRVGEYQQAPGHISRPSRILGHRLPEELDRVEEVRRLKLPKEWQSIIQDSARRDVVVERRLGKGRIWYQAADLRGYRLATLLSWLLEMAGIRKEISLYDTYDGKCAQNILISLRNYDDHQAILLRNEDNYAKDLRIRLAHPRRESTVTDPLEELEILLPQHERTWSRKELRLGGIPCRIEPSDFRLLILRWKKEPLEFESLLR